MNFERTSFDQTTSSRSPKLSPSQTQILLVISRKFKSNFL